MSKLPLKPGTLARLAPLAAVSVVVVDAELAAKFHTHCQQGDIDACHLTLLKLQQRYPESVYDQENELETTSHTPAKHQRMLTTYQPLYDVLGHGFSAAATANHVDLVEYLLSSAFASVFRDGICMDKLKFPPFPLLQHHELACCVSSVRFVAFMALACVDQLSQRSFQFLVETQTLWDFEASLCLSLAMRHALTAATRDASTSSVSPAAFHPMIVLLTKHYDFLIDEIRCFHEKFRPEDSADDRAWDQFDSMRALQASLLYEIVLASGHERLQ